MAATAATALTAAADPSALGATAHASALGSATSGGGPRASTPARAHKASDAADIGARRAERGPALRLEALGSAYQAQNAAPARAKHFQDPAAQHGDANTLGNDRAWHTG